MLARRPDRYDDDTGQLGTAYRTRWWRWRKVCSTPVARPKSPRTRPQTAVGSTALSADDSLCLAGGSATAAPQPRGCAVLKAILHDYFGQVRFQGGQRVAHQ